MLSDAGKVTEEIASIVQDRLFESDFDRVVAETRRLEGKLETRAIGPGKKGRKR